MNMLFIGAGYFPFRVCGDKNYFLHLLPLLSRGKNKVVVLSLNDHHDELTIQQTGVNAIVIYNISRPFHIGDRKRFYGQVGALLHYHHLHGIFLEVIEKYLSIVMNLSILRKIVDKHQIQLIDFMDNFGPAMRFVKSRLPNVKICYSAMNYQPRGLLYHRYLTHSMERLDCLIPYTDCYRRKLLELGMHSSRIQVIRWGVEIKNTYLEASQKRKLKEELGLHPKKKLLLWSGFLQQIRESDFYRTLGVAKSVASKKNDIEFVFSFKPEHKRKKYLDLSEEKVKVISDIQDFRGLLETADLFLSPVENARSIVAPPLTWIEAMSLGTPIVTTRVGGVDEIVIDGETGYVASTFEQLEEKIDKAIMNREIDRMSNSCRSLIRNKYNIKKSAEDYLNLFRAIINNEPI